MRQHSLLRERNNVSDGSRACNIENDLITFMDKRILKIFYRYKGLKEHCSTICLSFSTSFISALRCNYKLRGREDEEQIFADNSFFGISIDSLSLHLSNKHLLKP